MEFSPEFVTVHVRVTASGRQCGYWLVWWLVQCVIAGRKPQWQGVHTNYPCIHVASH